MTRAEDAQETVLGAAFVQQRFARYASLRREGPARVVTLPDGSRVWLVTRYEEARAALASPVLSKDSRRAAPLHERRHAEREREGEQRPEQEQEQARERAREKEREEPRAPFPEALNAHMLNRDPPDHTRLRRLVGKAFTTRRVELLRPRVEEITAGLLAELAARDEADLLDSFAFPLPLAVICELFGVPQADRAPLRLWSDVIARHGYAPEARAATFTMAEFLSDLVARRRRHPTDDMLGALVQASDEGDRLSETEVVAMAFLLLTAGHETTAHLIGNGVLALLSAPDQLAAVRADPAALLPGAVEEILRHLSPTGVTTLRFTTAPLLLGEVEIPEDEFVVIALESANRDQARFEDADRLDVGREDNGHLAFGHGVHRCLGAPLARLEGRIALGGLLDRFPRLALAAAPEDLRWRDSLLFRGLEALPVRLS